MFSASPIAGLGSLEDFIGINIREADLDPRMRA
jgi:hypothetical protein